MAISGRWARVAVDRDRCLVYGPRLGRLYLLGQKESTQHLLQTLLGLGSLTACAELADPAGEIVHNLSNLAESPPFEAPARLRIAYRILQYSRRIVPFALMARLLRRIAQASSDSSQHTISDIGRLVHGIECAVGCSNCYPRALMTSYLCLKSGRTCDLAIGVLAPTRKMHAWCSTGGQLPFEPSPEHYLYSPLLILTLSP